MIVTGSRLTKTPPNAHSGIASGTARRVVATTVAKQNGAGRTIERHRAWFRSPALVLFLIVAQAVVHRLFWATPQPDREYLNLIPPDVLLTPVGDRVTYLHLFAALIPRDMVLAQSAQFVVLAAIVFLWLSRRVQLCEVDGAAAVGQAAAGGS